MRRDLTGQKFGRLTVIDEAPPRIRGDGCKVTYWNCECDCGTKKEICGYSLTRGETVSCGCWRKEKAKVDLIGKKFTNLTVIEEAGRNKDGRVIWLCKCDCGNYHKTLGKYLLEGSTTSCGCRRAKILADEAEAIKTHGMSNTKLYSVWSGMKRRCNNPNDDSYNNYGGRGIKVCEDWNKFENFYEWAINNGYSGELTIDRINVDGDYEPSNCRWADHKTQGNNTRRNHYLTYKGVTKTMSEWADISGISYYTLRGRINQYHWSVEKALETPVRKHK